MENQNIPDIQNLIENSNVYDKRKELVGTIPITGIIKKTEDSQGSFVLTGYDVDDICPPWWRWPLPWPPRRRIDREPEEPPFPPRPWPPRRDGPHPWIQKGIKIDVKDVVHYEIIDKSENGENIVRVFIDDHAATQVTVGIRLIDLVSIGPKQED